MDKIKLWIMASRPKTLTASLIPILVGTTLAYSVQGSIHWFLAFCALMSAFCIQIATNLINDALDFKKGADTETRIGPKRVTQSGLVSTQTVLNVGFLFLTGAVLFAIPLIVHSGWPLLIVTIFSVALAYLYTGGPFPLAYCGLGDLFVFLFFGLVSTSAAYYIQTGAVDGKALLAGTQIGFLATVIIAINNLRDVEGDAIAKKNTMAVCFGQLFARLEITVLAFLPFLLGFLWNDMGYDFASWVPIVMLPFAGRIVKLIWQTPPNPAYNQFLAYSALLQVLFGLLLCLGFLAR